MAEADAPAPLPSEQIQPPPSGGFSWMNKVFKPLGMIFLTFNLFIIPQIIIGFIFAFVVAISGMSLLDEIADGDRIGLSFAIYGVAELMTIGGLIVALAAFGANLKSIGVRMAGINKLWMIIPGFVVYFLITTAFLTLSSLFLSQEVLDADQDIGFENATQAWELVLAFGALVIIAPVVEELLFRGFLFKGLRHYWSFPVSAVVSSLLFGLAHFQLNVGIDTFALALVLAYLVEKTNNLWPAIGLHALKNLVAFTFLFIVG